jgi:ABC-2 type transport system ATP-binding protein
MSAAVLELIEVSKNFRSNWTFRSTPAVADLSLSMRAGEVYGLIGHNGAGKTTTFKLLVGLLRPTRGTLLWEGRRLDWNSPRTGIGFSPEQPYFYDYLTVGETLEFYAQLYGMNRNERRQRITQLVESFRIGHKLHAPMRTLSKGTLQRVAVAQAILHRPQLAILDEPMSGLDPSGRKEMRELIAALKREGTAVLFSSHILSDAEALCDRVAILASGRVREVVELSSDVALPSSYTMVVAGASGRALEALGRIATEPLAGGPLRWNVRLPDQGAVQSALAALHGTDAAVEAVLPERPSLEQRFMRYANGNGAQAD